LLPFPQTAVSAVRRSFPAARLDCGVTLEGGSLTLTNEGHRSAARNGALGANIAWIAVASVRSADTACPSPKLAIASTVAWAHSRSDR